MRDASHERSREGRREGPMTQEDGSREDEAEVVRVEEAEAKRVDEAEGEAEVTNLVEGGALAEAMIAPRGSYVLSTLRYSTVSSLTAEASEAIH